MSDMKTKRIESGEVFPPDWFGCLWDDIRAGILRGDGRTCRVNRTPEGTTITVLRQPQSVGGGGGAGGDAVAGALTVGPSGGYGSATFQAAVIATNGTWAATGATSSVIVPILL